jgi:hypothetical protein
MTYAICLKLLDLDSLLSYEVGILPTFYQYCIEFKEIGHDALGINYPVKDWKCIQEITVLQLKISRNQLEIWWLLIEFIGDNAVISILL